MAALPILLVGSSSAVQLLGQLAESPELLNAIIGGSHAPDSTEASLQTALRQLKRHLVAQQSPDDATSSRQDQQPDPAAAKQQTGTPQTSPFAAAAAEAGALELGAEAHIGELPAATTTAGAGSSRPSAPSAQPSMSSVLTAEGGAAAAADGANQHAAPGHESRPGVAAQAPASDANTATDFAASSDGDDTESTPAAAAAAVMAALANLLPGIPASSVMGRHREAAPAAMTPAPPAQHWVVEAVQDHRQHAAALASLSGGRDVEGGGQPLSPPTQLQPIRTRHFGKGGPGAAAAAGSHSDTPTGERRKEACCFEVEGLQLDQQL